MIPMCWKCSNAVMRDSEDMPGAKVLDHCEVKPGIDSWEKASALCPLTNRESEVQSSK